MEVVLGLPDCKKRDCNSSSPLAIWSQCKTQCFDPAELRKVSLHGDGGSNQLSGPGQVLRQRLRWRTGRKVVVVGINADL